MTIQTNSFILAGTSSSHYRNTAYSRNKKSGLSDSIQPDEDDIYNEIDMEDLRGPAVDTTIRLDVQEKDDEMEGDDGQVARGIVSGKSQEVR